MPKTIMVVDDDKDVRDTVTSVLKRSGFNVTTAVNGDDCLRKVSKAKKRPDLILMDIMMPGTPVRKIIPKLKTKVAYLSVVKTTDAEKEALMKIKNVVGFIPKPFDIDDIVKKVKRMVKK